MIYISSALWVRPTMMLINQFVENARKKFIQQWAKTCQFVTEQWCCCHWHLVHYAKWQLWLLDPLVHILIKPGGRQIVLHLLWNRLGHPGFTKQAACNVLRFSIIGPTLTRNNARVIMTLCLSPLLLHLPSAVSTANQRRKYYFFVGPWNILTHCRQKWKPLSSTQSAV